MFEADVDFESLGDGLGARAAGVVVSLAAAVLLLVFGMEIREFISGGKVRGWDGHHGNVRALTFASDGRLVSGSSDGTVKKWVVETGTEVWARDFGVGFVMDLAELDDDGRLVVGVEDMSVRVLDGATGQEIFSCAGHTVWVAAVVPLGAGSFASSGSIDLTIRVWAGGGTVARVVEIAEAALSLSPSPCGRFVAAGCANGLQILYRLPDWDLVWSVKVHKGEVLSVSWSPDGRFLASGSFDGMVGVLCAKTGATLRVLEGHTDRVFFVLFSHDGTRVLSGSPDDDVRVWRIFLKAERGVRGLVAGLVVDAGDWEMREVCGEVVGRMMRLWEVEAD
jgi:hypothetical protein